MKKKSPKPESLIHRGVVYRLIEYLASMEQSSIWKLICVICVCNILTVGVHLSSTPSISGPGSATVRSFHFEGMRGVFKLKIQQLHIVISASIKYTDQTAQFARAGLYNGNRPQIEALLDFEKLKM